MRELVLSAGNGRSIKKAKRIAKEDGSAVIRREFGELFEALHDRLVRIERILCLLPSGEDALKRIEELTGAKTEGENNRLRSAIRSPYF